MSDLLTNLARLADRYAQLTEQLGDPSIAAGSARYLTLLREHARLGRIAAPWADHEAARRAAEGTRAMLDDPEFRDLAREELASADATAAGIIERIKGLLVTNDAAATRDCILEIRAGTGGDEACLFAGDLARMYTQWTGKHGLTLDPMTVAEGEKGGFKELVFSVRGDGAFGLLRYESGGHRVQRVPETEAAGRIHTSACTVAVLREAEEVDIQIRPDELRIDVFRAGGAGGQHVNKTESAVRITHLPTGVVAICQDEKSQISNRERAMRVLRARLFDAAQERIARERAAVRKEQVGSGDRSDRIRTYNFPQNRITDHRIGWTGYSLDRFIAGDCDELHQALIEAEKARFLAEWDGSY